MTTPEGKCTVGGNRKCNHLSWDEFGGYRDGCCTPDQKCGLDEGDCSDDSDCHAGLVCGTKNCPKGVGFSERASCCEPISGVFKPSRSKHMCFHIFYVATIISQLTDFVSEGIRYIFIIVYGYRKISNKAILSHDCDEYKHGQYSNIDDAKKACKKDANCSAIYDKNCGDDAVFHLCTNMDDVLKDSHSSCVHAKIIIGKGQEQLFLR